MEIRTQPPPHCVGVLYLKAQTEDERRWLAKVADVVNGEPLALMGTGRHPPCYPKCVEFDKTGGGNVVCVRCRWEKDGG